MSACAVEVVTSAGERVALGTPAESYLPVPELRARVASAWGVSPDWVRLLCGTSVLSDADAIDSTGPVPSSGIITIAAILVPVCDKSQLGSQAESADIINERGAPVSFPPPQDISINMMPFILGDKGSIPVQYLQYWPIIQQCVTSAPEFHHTKMDGTIAYLTIHESQVEAGCTQRRPGIHCESPGCNHALGGGDMLRWGLMRTGKVVSRSGGIFMCSNVSDSCRVWNVKIEEPGTAIGPLGSLEHFRDCLESTFSFTPDAGEIVWITDTTPHESLPMKTSTYRQYFRLVVGDVSVWYKKHSTPNEMGVEPDAKTKIVCGDKFEDAKSRGYMDAGRSTSAVATSASLPTVEHVVLRQAEGHPCVRIFAEPKKGATLLTEVESGEQVQLLGELCDFRKIRCKDVDGWVGVKNCVYPIATVALRQFEGHPSVRVFDEPQHDSRILGEIPNSEEALVTALHGDFLKVHWGKLQGWVGKKNVTDPEPC